MSNARWTREEELQLIKDISNGNSLETLAQKHNRSVSALEMRLEKIIYENYVSGRSLQEISRLLRLNIDKVTQHYYSYKKFKEKHSNGQENNTVQQVVNPVYPVQQVINQQLPTQQIQSNQPNQINHPINHPISQQLNTIQTGAGRRDDNFADKFAEKVEKAFAEPNNLDKIESKLRRLEVENRILKLVVENKELTQQLNKLIKEGKVDPSIKQLIKMLRKTTK